MRKIFSAIGLILVVGVAAILIIAATKPDTFRVERSAIIDASPEEIFALINDFHRWQEWSPWEKLDPAMTKTHSGPASGVGAVYEWAGNADVGKGRMEITETTPPAQVVVQLDFLEPFAASNMTTFTLSPAGEATNVSWEMTGAQNFITKIMSVFISMDAMIGGDFEKGLENLKTIAEAE